jgi:hypothetical protein
MGILLAFLRPLTTYFLIGFASILGVTAAYYKVRHDEKVRVMQQIEKEKSDAIAKAKDARQRFFDLCARTPDCRVPDDWFRD